MLFGNVEIFVLSDGNPMSDAGGVYGLVPRPLWEKITPPDDKNRVPTALNSLLVISQNKKILIDTGLGDKLDEQGEERVGRTGGSTFLQELSKIGYAPEDIDIVINTHLHSDHCGGNTRFQGDRIVATFPNAEYWIQRLELADASFPNERTRGTYFPENFKPIRDRIRILDGDTRVTDEVKCIITRGHTRAHQSVLIESAGQKALFIGDIAARTVYLERLAWIPAFDVEPLETLETKRRLRDWAVEEGMLLFFQHDPFVNMACMRKDGDKFRIDRMG